MHQDFSIRTFIVKKVLRFSQAVSYLGGFLAFTFGMSSFSFVQLLTSFFCILIPFKCKRTKATGIPTLGTKNRFHLLTEKLYHLNKDLKDFVKMSSIHGVRNLTGSFRKKVFWLSVIAVATASYVHFVRELLDVSPVNELSMEFDDEMWNVNDVIVISC